MVVSPADFIDVGEPNEPGAANDATDVDPNDLAVAAPLGAGTQRPPVDLPYTFAKRHGVLIEQVGGEMHLVHKPGVSVMALTEARRKTAGLAMTMEKVTSDDFDARLTRHYEGETGQAFEIMEDLGDDLDLDALADAIPEPEDLLESTDNAPVIKLINALLTKAVREQASDIHVEPFEKRLAVRYRVDGVMQKLYDPPREIAPLIISRLKVMAKLDIS